MHIFHCINCELLFSTRFQFHKQTSQATSEVYTVRLLCAIRNKKWDVNRWRVHSSNHLPRAHHGTFAQMHCTWLHIKSCCVFFLVKMERINRMCKPLHFDAVAVIYTYIYIYVESDAVIKKEIRFVVRKSSLSLTHSQPHDFLCIWTYIANARKKVKTNSKKAESEVKKIKTSLRIIGVADQVGVDRAHCFGSRQEDTVNQFNKHCTFRPQSRERNKRSLQKKETNFPKSSWLTAAKNCAN